MTKSQTIQKQTTQILRDSGFPALIGSMGIGPDRESRMVLDSEDADEVRRAVAFLTSQPTMVEIESPHTDNDGITWAVLRVDG